MDGSSLQRIRDALLDKRQRIDSGLEQREVGAPLDMSDNQSEIIDLAQAIEQLDRDTSLAEQERRELAAIERALAKMAMGQFGVCEECEEEIADKRLMVVPEARLCARCQALQERQIRGRGIARSAAS